MVRGKVDVNRQAWVSIEMVGPDAQLRTVEAILDTGFTGSLTLTPDLIQQLGLAWSDTTEVTLASGEQEWWDSWTGQVLWQQRVRLVQILESNGTPLMGMELLENSQLTIQVRLGGDVLIEEMGEARQ